MKRRKGYFVLVLLMLLVLSCINFGGGASEAEKLQTAVAETIAARDLPAEDDPDDGGNGSVPTATTKPVDTQPSPPTETPKPCNEAKFVSETIPDGTEFDPGDNFVKTWRFRNTGTCTWNTNYKLKFKSGDQMGGAASVSLANTVAPGETVDLSVNLKAPGSSGTYKGVWRFVSDDDEEMIHNIWAEIKVNAPTFAVTSVSMSAIPPAFVGPCPFPFTIKADITVNGAGTVTYYFKRWDNLEFGHGAVNFASAGTKTVSGLSVEIAPGPHWAKIYIDDPNNQLFGLADYILTCIP
jgi:hypothetical protein